MFRQVHVNFNLGLGPPLNFDGRNSTAAAASKGFLKAVADAPTTAPTPTPTPPTPAPTPAWMLGCSDTPNFLSTKGLSCNRYFEHGYCVNGSVPNEYKWTVGAKYDFPEKHCCACGKAAAAPAAAPATGGKPPEGKED